MHPNGQKLGQMYQAMGSSDLSVRLFFLVEAHRPCHSHFTLLLPHHRVHAQVKAMQHSLWGETRER
jgi:hypothetical protein